MHPPIYAITDKEASFYAAVIRFHHTKLREDIRAKTRMFKQRHKRASVDDYVVTKLDFQEEPPRLEVNFLNHFLALHPDSPVNLDTVPRDQPMACGKFISGTTWFLFFVSC